MREREMRRSNNFVINRFRWVWRRVGVCAHEPGVLCKDSRVGNQWRKGPECKGK